MWVKTHENTVVNLDSGTLLQLVDIAGTGKIGCDSPAGYRDIFSGDVGQAQKIFEALAKRLGVRPVEDLPKGNE